MDVLDRALFGDFTVLHALVLAVAMLMVAGILKVFGAKPEPPMAAHKVHKACPACSGSGSVSTQFPRCPKCGAKLPA